MAIRLDSLTLENVERLVEDALGDPDSCKVKGVDPRELDRFLYWSRQFRAERKTNPKIKKLAAVIASEEAADITDPEEDQ